MSEETRPGMVVLAQGGVDHLRELQRFLSARGVDTELVKPPGFTGKG